MSTQAHANEHHISSTKQLLMVAIGLALLTFLTVFMAKVIALPEPYGVIVAISIAIVKAFLVVAFFMNLYWDNKFHALLLITAFLFFLLMISITLLDTLYRPEIIPSF